MTGSCFGRSILILGGTAEARALAVRLADEGAAVKLSLAGVTRAPRDQGVPTRIGGFGGAQGLTAYLRDHDVEMLVDATHPYAATISANAARAATVTARPIVALRRPPWTPREGDDWREMPSLDAALTAIGDRPRRLFVALGRKEIAPLRSAPQHFYLIRSVDPIDAGLAPGNRLEILARGPFSVDDERELLRSLRIDAIVCKNSGGTAAAAKLQAARELGLPVYLLKRPDLPDVPCAIDVEGTLAMIETTIGGRSLTLR